MKLHFESAEEVDRALSKNSVQKLLSSGLSLGRRKSYMELSYDLKLNRGKCEVCLVSCLISTLFFEAQTIPRCANRRRVLGMGAAMRLFSQFDIEFLRKAEEYITVPRFKACIFDLLGNDEKAVDLYFSMPFKPWEWDDDYIHEDWNALIVFLCNKKWVSKKQRFLTIVEEASGRFNECSISEINMVTEMICRIGPLREYAARYAHVLEEIIRGRKRLGLTEDFIQLLMKSKEFAKKYDFDDFVKRLTIIEFSTRLHLANEIIRLKSVECWAPAIGHLEACNNMLKKVLHICIDSEESCKELENRFYWQYVKYRSLAIHAKMNMNFINLNISLVTRLCDGNVLNFNSSDDLFKKLFEMKPIQRNEVDSGMGDAGRQMFCDFLDFDVVDGTRIVGSYKSDDAVNKSKLIEKYVVAHIAAYIAQSNILIMCEKLKDSRDLVRKIIESRFAALPNHWYQTMREQVKVGILLGLGGDFYAANMVLLPLLESLVRNKLENLNESTRFITNDREKEMVLSSLIEKPKFNGCFYEDIRQNIKWLYGSAPSLNLRNALCHGLCDDADVSASKALLCYSWWLATKVFWTDSAK